MQNHPNDGSNDNPDEFSEFRKPDTDPKANDLAENHREGAKRAGTPTAATPAGTPQYGEFGGTAAADDTFSRPAGNNPGGVAAPSVAAPEQRGGAPQNLATNQVRATQNAPADERHEAYKEDDPRYGSGTRNWESEEPANRTERSAEDPNDNTLS